jgi:hypothetical protein
MSEESEIALVRNEIKADMNGLRNLLNAKFSELGRCIKDMKESSDKQNAIVHERIDAHDDEIDSLNAWKNWVNGSVRTIFYILVVIGGLTGIVALIKGS